MNRLRKKIITRIIVHGLEPELGKHQVFDADSLVDAFLDTKKYAPGYYTGGKVPYHKLYKPKHGVMLDVLPLMLNGVHARIYNDESVGVAVLGYWKKDTFTKYDDLAHYLMSIAVTVMEYTGDFPTLHGHTELPGGSSDKNKVCPGRGIDMERLRDEYEDLVFGWSNTCR